MAETKTVLVPEGLSGERIDTALARLLGLSRSRAADLAGAVMTSGQGVITIAP